MSATIVGRERELVEAERFLGDVAAGPCGLMVEGEVGIGKTELWRAVVDRGLARGYRVLTCRADQAEARLSLPALADLLGEAADSVLPSLPLPQRAALEAALLRTNPVGTVTSPRAVAAGVTSALRELSAASPVVVAVDDVHWLDGSTARALAFAVRRLYGRPIGFLVAVRIPCDLPDRLGLERAFGPDRVARLRVGPLSAGALRAMLASRLGRTYTRPMLRRICQASGGNPLFALEIARALEGANTLDPGRPLPVPDTLRELVGKRLSALPRAARESLLAAAAAARPTVELVERATSAAGLAVAEEAGLLRTDGDRVCFNHPLYAFAVYAAAPARRRRRVHDRLANLVGDPEERARHLALATTGPDEKVAAALEQAADLARSRGSWESAGELLELARGLSGPGRPSDACRRGLRAAEHYLHAGDRPRARALREEIASTSPSPAASWQTLGVTSASRPSLAPAFDRGVALAWREPGSDRIKVRLYSPSESKWEGPIDVAVAAAGDPQLVWDGTALNLFFVDRADLLRHMYATETSLAFRDQVVVSATPVLSSAFHALAWNGRLHVAFARRGTSQVQYTVSRTAFGTASQWVPAAPVGFSSTVAPRLAALGDNLFLVGVSGGRVRYARRDATRPGPEVTGNPVAGIWLTPGRPVDPAATGRYLGDVDLLTWNGDVYLAANVLAAGTPGYHLRLVNLSRAVFKQLITERWGIKLRWGALGGRRLTDAAQAPVVLAKGSDIPMLGDFDGNGMTDLAKFTVRGAVDAGPAPVYVAPAPDWKVRRVHTFHVLGKAVPGVGDFNGDGRDDLLLFTQRRMRSVGPAPVLVALAYGGEGIAFPPASRVWHRFFSLKGEIPLVGDFNGDGKDDIVTFVQREQKDAAGKSIGPAPVWVALSNGHKFETSRVWHRFFSLKGEIPLVGDFNGDGKDDIVTFVHDRVKGERARAVFVALSQGSSFSRSFTWASDFAGKDDTPAVGAGVRLSEITGRSEDASKRTADLFAFRRTNGSVFLLDAMGSVPYPSGAPWERYKWFTDKGLGVSQFPEWIWRRPRHCLGVPHSFVLLGRAGSGSETVTNLSVRAGSRQGHVLEELGHSLFANCFRKKQDPMHAGIYTSLGIDAGDLWGGGSMRSVDCPGGDDSAGVSAETIPPHPLSLARARIPFYDCRRDIAEHYFLELMRRYKIFGDEFRQLIRRTRDTARRAPPAPVQLAQEQLVRRGRVQARPGRRRRYDAGGPPLLARRVSGAGAAAAGSAAATASAATASAATASAATASSFLSHRYHLRHFGHGRAGKRSRSAHGCQRPVRGAGRDLQCRARHRLREGSRRDIRLRPLRHGGGRALCGGRVLHCARPGDLQYRQAQGQGLGGLLLPACTTGAGAADGLRQRRGRRHGPGDAGGERQSDADLDSPRDQPGIGGDPPARGLDPGWVQQRPRGR